MSVKNDYLESLTDYRPNICVCGGDVWETREGNDGIKVYRITEAHTRGLGGGLDAWYYAQWVTSYYPRRIMRGYLDVHAGGASVSRRVTFGDGDDTSAFFRAVRAARRLVHLVTDVADFDAGDTPRNTDEFHAALWLSNTFDVAAEFGTAMYPDGINCVDDIPADAWELWTQCRDYVGDTLDALLEEYDAVTDDNSRAMSVCIARELLSLLSTDDLTGELFGVSDVARWVIAPMACDYIASALNY